MAYFLAALLAWTFVLTLFSLFLAGFFLQNLFGIIFLLAVIFAIFTAIFTMQSDKIETLETRIAALENKSKENTND